MLLGLMYNYPVCHYHENGNLYNFLGSHLRGNDRKRYGKININQSGKKFRTSRICEYFYIKRLKAKNRSGKQSKINLETIGSQKKDSNASANLS